jgi:hypothetical protein
MPQYKPKIEDMIIINGIVDELRPLRKPEREVRNAVINYVDMLFEHTEARKTHARNQMSRSKVKPALDKLIFYIESLPEDDALFSLFFLPQTRDEKPMQISCLIDGLYRLKRRCIQHKSLDNNKLDLTKSRCARFAHDLFWYSKKRPTSTEGGSLWTIASLFYELATGKRHVPLKRYCLRQVRQFAIAR